ncbi:MAG: DUF1778 domain-containing protein [Rhizobiaceae bacterium]
MPRAASNATSRIELRVRDDQKALIARAAAIRNLDVTGFIMDAVMPEAEAVIERAEKIILSERDSRRLLELLENPPAPTERLLRAMKSFKTL